MVEVAILNVTGYAGLGAALLVEQHPDMRLVAASGRSDAGRRLGTVFPFWPGVNLRIEETVPPVDLVLCCLPHGAAAAQVAALLAAGSRVVDVSADFRLHDLGAYQQWYGEHGAPELLDRAVYGLPELHAPRLASATLVANPGCYPTAAILALAPAIAAGIVEPSVIVDAKSGVSGGGRSLTLSNHFSETDESVHAYGLQGHRHAPEMVQELSLLQGAPVQVLFTPHLVPMVRGLLATCYAKLRAPIAQDELSNVYREFYAGAAFTRVVDSAPRTKWCSGANYCFVHAAVSHGGSHLVAMAAIDNLGKGAAGQAVQNANLLLGLPERAGLGQTPVFP
ncbi:MAG TPA: N-acetyl-gamma-glutamyl-phosphate reductase [Chloroflexota bacterium]|nr:N-acetyl-gamma-glutamyl-phosphate reductase [Chloroflexota bacterium]